MDSSGPEARPAEIAPAGTQHPPPDTAFPIVGIGSSAGGLEAASALLRALPASTGMAFVLVQHLDPKHESSLVELLARVSLLPVVEAVDGARVEREHVYVIPPNHGMTLREGSLHLTPRVRSGEPQRPIDEFLRSLAHQRGARGIAVVLSGTGSDGTLGASAIKAEGGITFAQDGTASYQGMPQSAIAGGVVDFVLPPEDIARQLIEIAAHLRQGKAGSGPPATDSAAESTSASASADEALGELFLLLRFASRVDFSSYKQTTILRRIHRRMVLKRLDRIEDYVALLRTDPAEVEALYKDVLIHVTSFFRDPPTFEALSSLVFPRFLVDRPADAAIRVWVPGCSTGEEVYSLAICLLECLESRSSAVPLKIFGTDVSEAVILKARSGWYPDSISSDVTPERLRRFFVRSGEGWQISKTVRDLCVFARHDVNRDPPFSNLDLISCRNVLIYLGPALQKRLMPIFHYALREGGTLLLGKSETVGFLTELYTVLDAARHIYTRRSVPSKLVFEYGGPEAKSDGSKGEGLMPPQGGRGVEIQREADRVLLARYAPPGVVVDEAFEILQFRGDTGAFLTPAPGTPSHNLLKMAREGLLPDLRASLQEAAAQDSVVRREAVRVGDGERETRIDLVILPIRVPLSTARRFLVLFEESSPHEAPHAAVTERPRPTEPGDAQDRVVRLERELAATKDYLRDVLEKHQASSEELQAANEEVRSSNEELQSTNEELQTAKEELQATNEELITINEELQARNVQSASLNNDLTNLLTSVSIPIVMVGPDLRIRRITPSAHKVLNLLPTDVGRPISDIHLRIGVPDLEALLLDVVETLTVLEREVQDREGRWYALSVRPYRTLDNKVDGAVIALADVDALKRSEQRIKAARDYAESIVMTVRESLVVLDGALKVRTGNPAFHHLFDLKPGEAEGRLLWELGGGGWEVKRIRALLEEVRYTGKPLDNLALEATLAEIGKRSLVLNGRLVPGGGDGESLLLVTLEDVTDRNREEAEARALQQKVQETQKLESLGVLAGGIAHDFNNILTAILGNANLATMAVEPTSPLLHYFKRIEDNSLRAADLCAQMLAYSGKGRFAVKRLDLSALVEDTVHLLRLSIQKKAVLALELEPDLPAVLCDATQIRQVLMNLVINASEAGNERTVHIRIQTGRMHADEAYLRAAHLASEVAEGEYVYLEVSDDGSGMSAETKARVFDPFFTTKFTGRGLGLAAVLGIVRGHGGALRVESEEGQGSTFRLLLPYTELPAEVQPAREEIVSWRGEGTVLVVDDEDDVRAVAARMLETLGFRVLEARDGREGLAVFRSHADDIALVLLDMTMPQLGGVEAFAELRKLRPDVRVVLMSGYDEQEAVEGTRGFLHKPFRLPDLAVRLRDAFVG